MMTTMAVAGRLGSSRAARAALLLLRDHSPRLAVSRARHLRAGVVVVVISSSIIIIIVFRICILVVRGARRHPVGDDVVDDGARDDVADVVGGARVAREGHADDAAEVVERRAARVARVDRGVDLHDQQLLGAAHVRGRVDARDDAARHARRVAAQRVADALDCGVELGQMFRERQRRHAAPETRLLNQQQRDVGGVRYDDGSRLEFRH
mmetsp:Transcript_23295/g.92392  ORF Transcript_23295/g.92392 Transcript_23295/m.92392 type:complete len:209 (+) Transcript_23295:1369-1995(+)